MFVTCICQKPFVSCHLHNLTTSDRFCFQRQPVLYDIRDSLRNFWALYLPSLDIPLDFARQAQVHLRRFVPKERRSTLFRYQRDSIPSLQSINCKGLKSRCFRRCCKGVNAVGFHLCIAQGVLPWPCQVVALFHPNMLPERTDCRPKQQCWSRIAPTRL